MLPSGLHSSITRPSRAGRADYAAPHPRGLPRHPLRQRRILRAASRLPRRRRPREPPARRPQPAAPDEGNDRPGDRGGACAAERRGGEAAGGDGLSYNIADGSTQTYYAGGGSAVPESTEPQGGGGTSNAYNSFADPGTANTGSGGCVGAANYNNPSYSLKGFGGYGGSGIVIVADATQLITNTSMTLISDTFTANATPSSARIVIFAELNDDINSEINASVTRDNSTFNAVTLTDEGYSAGAAGIKIFSGTTPLTGTGSPQVQLRWKIVGSSLEGTNKIHGVSLQWK